MAKSLIITEKPSVAQEFARILGVSGRNDGYIENDKYVITWCVGHLVEMVYPEEYDEKYKRWRLEDLPFLPEEYKYNVIPDVSKQYDTVHRMLFREDIETVYWAGDAGKEGQTIEENIRRFGGVRPGMKELRVWIDSQTEEEILRGIREAKPMAEYDNLAKSGIMRTIEDYAMGINFSRAMSVKYGKLLNDAAATKSYTAIAVGRVMTCVLGMVVIREREIRNFAETPFYRVVGGFLPEGAETEETVTAEWKAVNGSKYFESPLLYKENGFKEEEKRALSDYRSNDKEFVKKLAFLAYNSNTYQVRMYGVFLFGYLSEQNDILTFMRDEVSKDDNWRVQEVLAKAFDEFCKNTGYEKALPIIDEWLENDNPNTRRAVTEGLRIWTSRPYFKDNPNEAIRRIVALKEDPSEYVRKSVGNALRDISKKFPELIKDELNNWKLESKEINQVYKLASKLIN